MDQQRWSRNSKKTQSHYGNYGIRYHWQSARVIVGFLVVNQVVLISQTKHVLWVFKIAISVEHKQSKLIMDGT